jgi:ribonuclease R
VGRITKAQPEYSKPKPPGIITRAEKIEMKINREEILDFMKAGAWKPLSIKELFRYLKIPKDKREPFKRLIKDMTAEGTLVKIRGGRYGLPSKMNLVTGELRCHPDGFGFVVPEDGGEDVYINPRRFGGAMHADSVVARVESLKRGGRREGRVIRVLKRAHRTVVGRFMRQKGFCAVVPSDRSILQDIVIPPGQTGRASEGMIVEAEITRWPAKYMSPIGRVKEVLGDPEDPDVEIEVIVRKYGLSQRFPADVLKEVKKVAMKVKADEMEKRVDLRGVNTFTIDGETARDFDDAVSIEGIVRSGTKKGYRLRVSIADVSHYVKQGSALDIEAYERGTSVYFPDRCIPMLPEPLSIGICSLNPGVDRLTVTVEIEFDSQGELKRKKFYESVIKSSERLTYTEVKKILADGDKALKKRYARILRDLKLMEELALNLMKRRGRDGSIDFDLPEPQIIIDIEGRIEDIVRSERNIAHRIIEEFMLAANRAVAGEFSGYPSLYRVHEAPDQESIRDFKEFVSSLGHPFKGKAGPNGHGPKAFQRVLESVQGSPVERLVNHVLLRSMKQARYSESNTGHFGLAFKQYTHFTSPIRRYPDLAVHRLLKKLIIKKYTKKERERQMEVLPVVADQSSARERNAMEAEREITDLKKAQFMKDKVGEVFGGFISGVTSFGFFVELKDYFVEGLVHVATLTDDYYTFLEREHRLVGERTKRSFTLGKEVMVEISNVNIERRRIDMVLAEPSKRRAAGVRPGKRRGGRRVRR